MMLWTTLLLAQAIAPSPEPPQIRVTGTAVVSAEPEQAAVDFGVTTEGADAETAARENATKIDAVLRALRQALGDDTDFETLSYTVRPNYRRPTPREEPVLTGYVASNLVRAEGLALNRLGEAIDAATAAGANNIHNIQFSLEDEDAARKDALTNAAKAARAKAQTLADALGVRIVRILTVTEGESDMPRPMPVYRAEMAMAQADVPTPVEPGTVEIRASVTLVVEITP